VRKHVIKGRLSFIVSSFESKKSDGIKLPHTNGGEKNRQIFQNRFTAV
jgi:hypothetical protein